MNEMPRRWLRAACLPFAVVLLVPAVILLAAAFYLRALVIGLGMGMAALIRRPPPPAVSTAPPHFLDAAVEIKSGSAKTTSR